MIILQKNIEEHNPSCPAILYHLNTVLINGNSRPGKQTLLLTS